MGKLTDHVALASDAVNLVDIIVDRIRERIIDVTTGVAVRNNRDIVSKADILAAARDLGLEQFTDPED